jgi:hypothetical protein
VYSDDCLLANCFYKKSAFAVVQRAMHSADYDDIINHDRKLEKNYNDSLFYLNTITNTKSSAKFDIASIRFDISKSNISQHISAIADAAKWHNG